MSSLILEVVTPDRKVLSETVDHVVLPTEEAGELDILPGHVPLMTIIKPGQLSYFIGGKTESIAIDKGFIQVIGDTVKVLTEAAVEVSEIDLNAVDEARRRAEEALAEAKSRNDDPDILEELETKARFALVQKIIAENKNN
jgi:F-type H+-transporting ATPase subunit epsilon